MYATEKKSLLYGIMTSYASKLKFLFIGIWLISSIFLISQNVSNVSKVSRVEFTPDEQLPLQDGRWSWLSFPRLNRDGNDPVSVAEILGGSNIVPDNYIDESKLQNLPIGLENIVENVYYYPNWQQGGQLPNAKSTLGYKLYLDYDDPQPHNKRLHLFGNLLDPSWGNVNLLDGHENWIGYYLPYTQDLPSALPDEFESRISSIKAQYWTCYNDEPVGEGAIWACVCNKGRVELKYGDMAIITTKEDINGFHWNYGGSNEGTLERPGTDYYTFTETSDYDPIFIELDTTGNPLEIGAFVQDSCIGATTVLDSDTMVLISAYTEGLSGEIYFEEYYGSNKSFSPPKTEYFVKTPQTRTMVKRMIHTSENQDYYIVSFKDHQETGSLIAKNTWILCQPNPIRAHATIRYQVPQEGFFEISLYNILQNQKVILNRGYCQEGVYSFSLNTKDLESKNLSGGVYILVLHINNTRAQTRVVYIR